MGIKAGNLNSLIFRNFAPFYPIQMEFSLKTFFQYSKNACNLFNTDFQIFKDVTKIRWHLWRHTFFKTSKLPYNGSNLTNFFF